MTSTELPLGNFSVSLSVSDLAASRSFYERLGFVEFPGVAADNMVILRNGPATIGLFQGMFEGNLLTFNPGWDADAAPLADFVDVRAIQRRLKAAGIRPTLEADESGAGPAALMVTDPDGNVILLDQHV
jgi:catechol 2,3-dioxygenase-like lactoylglutathione lyase family enzyme